MSLALIGVVLLSAVLHASWNAWVKATGKAAHAMGLVSLGWCLAAAAALPFLPSPARSSWPFIFASVVIHLGYMVGLARLYDAADLSRAYVLVRAIPPLIVTGISMVWLGERLGGARWVGVLFVLSGVLAVAPPRRDAWTGTVVRALVPTVLSIAAYTLVDGVGARRSGAPVAYALWLSVLQGGLYIGYLLVKEGRVFTTFVQQNAGRGTIAGLASVVAYTSVLWTMTQAPIGLVAALRESSVLVASFLGGVLLGERVPSGAYIGAALVVVGAIAMR